MTAPVSPWDPPTQVKPESTSVATNHRWSAGHRRCGAGSSSSLDEPVAGSVAPQWPTSSRWPRKSMYSRLGIRTFGPVRTLAGKPRRDASRGLTVHATYGPGPQSVEMVVEGTLRQSHALEDPVQGQRRGAEGRDQAQPFVEPVVPAGTRGAALLWSPVSAARPAIPPRNIMQSRTTVPGPAVAPLRRRARREYWTRAAR